MSFLWVHLHIEMRTIDSPLKKLQDAGFKDNLIAPPPPPKDPFNKGPDFWRYVSPACLGGLRSPPPPRAIPLHKLHLFYSQLQ